MSDDPQQYIPSVPEIDQHGGDDLPTYEDLAAQNGPNSRFGRWKGWIEKRAAERYADITDEEFARRRQRGWGDSVHDPEPEPQYAESSIASAAPPNLPHPHLHIQTELSTPASAEFPDDLDDPAPSRGEVLSPSRLALHQFGSRFLPHTTAPIRCLLPILNDTLLLIGHDDGLSVLDMFPKEWTDRGLIEHGPNEAQAHHIWVGEGVYQLSLLESESTGEGTPQGVVLALVGNENGSPKEQESVRAIRMYNLASLVNLAKWAVVQAPGVPPLRMDGLGAGKCTTNSGKAHHHKSIPALAKGLKNMKLDSPVVQSPYTRDLHGSTSSFGAVPGSQPFKPEPQRAGSTESAFTIDSSWDVVEDLPIRWAMDYVPLAPPGTRLCGTSVVSYDLWREFNERRRGAAYLAVVVKSNILLYHAPKGERAFRFVKDFYTPLSARSVVFVQQSVQDMTRSPSDVGPRTSRSPPNHHHHHSRHSKGMSVGGTTPLFYPSQLSIFVIFEKKAGLIRIADSAVGEVELYDDPFSSLQNLLSPSSSTGGSLSRRSRSSWDGSKGFVKDSKAPWIAPAKINIPSFANRSTFSQSMYILTRGKTSHILPNPLPANLSSTPPYRIIHWSSPPTHIQTRTCRPEDETPPYLQIVAFGEYGVEVQEMDLSSISQKQKKGKGRADEIRYAQTDVGGDDTGFLVAGGHWDKQLYSDYSPTTICETLDSVSVSELSTEELVDVLHSFEGMYGWVRKGHGDWRVFWLGGGNVCREE